MTKSIFYIPLGFRPLRRKPRPPVARPADRALGLSLEFWFCGDIKLMVSCDCTALALMTALLPMSGALSGEVARGRPVTFVGEGILGIEAFVDDSDRNNAACLPTDGVNEPLLRASAFSKVDEGEVRADDVSVLVFALCAPASWPAAWLASSLEGRAEEGLEPGFVVWILVMRGLP